MIFSFKSPNGTLRSALIGIGVWLAMQAGHADTDLVVVVAANSTVTQLDQDQVANIFLDRSASLPNGTTALPTDAPERSEVRDRFYIALCGRSPAQMKAYWSRLIFTGRGKPPREAGSTDAVKNFVRTTPGGIGYLEASNVDSTVKVVLHLR